MPHRTPKHAACIALALLAGQAAAATSSFTAGAEGWTSAGFADTGYPQFSTAPTTSAVAYNASGGNGGGYVAKADPDGNWQYFSAPAAFLGNQSAGIGQNLTFDERVFNTFGESVLNPQGPLVAITNGSTTLVYGGGGATAALVGSGWNSFVVPLVAASWKVGSPVGAVATPAQFSSVMSSLTGLYLLSDFWGGNGATGEVLGLDNVVFPSAVPEPAPALAWLVGLGALSMVARRRRGR